MRLVPLGLGAFGSLFLGVGLWLLLSEGPQRAADRGAALPVVDATALQSRNVGESVLLEGRIAPGTAPGFREFVAWRRERFDGVEDSGPSKGQERWTHLETVAPPLAVVAGGGVVPVVNRGYNLQGAQHRWQESTTGSTGLFARRPERAAGFFADDRVVVDARVVAEPGAEGALASKALEASVLFGGDRAGYLADLQAGIRAARLVGGVFLGVGAVVLIVATVIGIRGGKSATKRPGRR